MYYILLCYFIAVTEDLCKDDPWIFILFLLTLLVPVVTYSWY